jgi:hypothetical protein
MKPTRSQFTILQQICDLIPGHLIIGDVGAQQTNGKVVTTISINDDRLIGNYAYAPSS